MTKYTKEVLETAVKSSFSVAQVVRSFGKKPVGGNQTYISNLIKKHDISTSHFTGRRTNQGPSHKGGPEKKSWQDVLVIDRRSQRKERVYMLRRALIESGVAYQCGCGQGPEWLGRPLVLQIDHINGNCLDNRKENLRFICPNCHSQTDNWGSKNARR